MLTDVVLCFYLVIAVHVVPVVSAARNTRTLEAGKTVIRARVLDKKCRRAHERHRRIGRHKILQHLLFYSLLWLGNASCRPCPYGSMYAPPHADEMLLLVVLWLTVGCIRRVYWRGSSDLSVHERKRYSADVPYFDLWCLCSIGQCTGSSLVKPDRREKPFLCTDRQAMRRRRHSPVTAYITCVLPKMPARVKGYRVYST